MKVLYKGQVMFCLKIEINRCKDTNGKLCPEFRSFFIWSYQKWWEINVQKVMDSLQNSIVG